MKWFSWWFSTWFDCSFHFCPSVAQLMWLFLVLFSYFSYCFYFFTFSTPSLLGQQIVVKYFLGAHHLSCLAVISHALSPNLTLSSFPLLAGSKKRHLEFFFSNLICLVYGLMLRIYHFAPPASTSSVQLMWFWLYDFHSYICINMRCSNILN